MKELNRLETIIYLILKNEPETNTGYKICNYIKTNFPLLPNTHQQVYRSVNKMALQSTTQQNEGKPDSRHYKLVEGIGYTIDYRIADVDVLVHFNEMDLLERRLKHLVKYLEKVKLNPRQKETHSYRQLDNEIKYINRILSGENPTWVSR